MTSADLRYCPRCATALALGPQAGRERAHCPACGWVHWDNPVPVVAAVIEYEGKVLLALAIGLIGILIYVSFRFNFQFGVAAVMSLIFVTVIELGFLSLTGMEITMTVIAAMLTVIGYAVNDSIVVSDRIREDVRKIRKDEARLDWTQPAVAIYAQVRAFNPWPVAETTWDGRQLRVWRCECEPLAVDAAPGTVLESSGGRIVVATGEGALRLLQLQQAGRRAMSAAEFLNASTLAGARLG